MPVCSISVFGSRSSNFGAGLWIGQRSVISSFSPSFGLRRSPVTFQTWPLVTAPTGTEIGAPVSHLGTASHAVGRLERDGAHHVVADVQGYLCGDGLPSPRRPRCR